MRISALILLLCVLSACSPRAYRTIERTATDTVIVNRVLHDTAVMVERDSSLLRALVECDSVGQARLVELIEYRSGRHLSVPAATIDNNELIVTAEVDSFSVAMSYLETHTELWRKETIVKSEVVEVNKLTSIQRALIYIGTLSIIGIMIFLLIKLKF